MNHTPTPWNAESDGDGLFRITATGYDIAAALCYDAANAALIVRAVNCHEELVAALYAMLEIIDDNKVRFGYQNGSPGAIRIETARAALKKAES